MSGLSAQCLRTFSSHTASSSSSSSRRLSVKQRQVLTPLLDLLAHQSLSHALPVRSPVLNPRTKGELLNSISTVMNKKLSVQHGQVDHQRKISWPQLLKMHLQWHQLERLKHVLMIDLNHCTGFTKLPVNIPPHVYVHLFVSAVPSSPSLFFKRNSCLARLIETQRLKLSTCKYSAGPNGIDFPIALEFGRLDHSLPAKCAISILTRDRGLQELKRHSSRTLCIEPYESEQLSTLFASNAEPNCSSNSESTPRRASYPSTTKHILLIDLDNQPQFVNWCLPFPSHVAVHIFSSGVAAPHIPVDSANFSALIAASAYHFTSCGTGRNAVDFGIAVEIGRIDVALPTDVAIIVVSRDSDFLSLSSHLRQRVVEVVPWLELSRRFEGMPKKSSPQS